MSDDLAWDTRATGIDYSCPGFDVRRDEVRFPNGEDGAFHYLEDEESVVVLPFTPDGDVVVVEEWRQAVGRVNLGLPAGGREPEDDDIEATVHRELTEETGYVADAVEHLATFEPANGVSNLVFHYYVARDCIGNGEQRLDHNESIRVELSTFDTLLDGVLSGAIRDGRTATCVMYYELVR